MTGKAKIIRAVGEVRSDGSAVLRVQEFSPQNMQQQLEQLDRDAAYSIEAGVFHINVHNF